MQLTEIDGYGNAMYSAEDVVNYIIYWNYHKDHELTNWKLQNLLYLLQGAFCARHGKRLIAEDFHVWKLGAYIPEIYYNYCAYGSIPIIKTKGELKNKIKVDDQFLIDFILEKYIDYRPGELADIVFATDPCEYVYKVFGTRSLIPYECIKSYFLLDEKEEEKPSDLPKNVQDLIDMFFALRHLYNSSKGEELF